MKNTGFVFLTCILTACGGANAPDEAPAATRFVALTQSGVPAVSQARHACIKDVRTELTWELKSDAPGLRNWRNTYSWYSPDEAHHELDYRGAPNGGACDGSDCDTWHYIAAANAEKRCGFDDWRLPSRDELFSISDPKKSTLPPKTDLELFPYTQAAEYWTAHDYSFQPDSAWAWSFEYAHDRVDWKKTPKYVRLVRGTPAALVAVKE